MINLEYEYKKGVMFLRIEGRVNKNNLLEIRKSLTEVVRIGGINVIFIDRNCCSGLDSNYFSYLI